MKQYNVMVGNRVFTTETDKATANQCAWDVSCWYSDALCYVSHKNGNVVAGTKKYKNGLEVTNG